MCSRSSAQVLEVCVCVCVCILSLKTFHLFSLHDFLHQKTFVKGIAILSLLNTKMFQIIPDSREVLCCKIRFVFPQSDSGIYHS